MDVSSPAYCLVVGRINRISYIRNNGEIIIQYGGGVNQSDLLLYHYEK